GEARAGRKKEGLLQQRPTMPFVPSSLRRGLLAVATAAAFVLPARTVADESDARSIRPFRVHVPDSDLADLRRRIAATRWPDKETVADASPGAQLARLQAPVRYCGTD